LVSSLVYCLIVCHAHYLDPRVKSFTVMMTDSATHNVHTTISGTDLKATCTFSYRTSPTVDSVKPKDTIEEASKTKQVSIETLTTQLKNVCTQSPHDVYWTYEICFGRTVRQFHGDDVYTLGAEASIVGNTQVYSKGQECSGLPSQPTRKTVVRFACQLTAMIPRIASIQESSMCVYDMLVTTHRVCGDTSYPIVNAAEPSQAPALDSGSEDWILEIVELEDQTFMCSVYSLELRSTGSKLSFSRFDLSMSGIPQSSAPQEFTARHPGRQVCGSDEVAFTRGHLVNLAPFNGKLSYLKIYG